VPPARKRGSCHGWLASNSIADGSSSTTCTDKSDGSIVLLPPVDAQHHAVVRHLPADLIERDRAWMSALVEGLVADLHQRPGTHAIEAWNGGSRRVAADTPFRLTLGVSHVESIGGVADAARQSNEGQTITLRPWRSRVMLE
jgi:hypothetical protein